LLSGVISLHKVAAYVANIAHII